MRQEFVGDHGGVGFDFDEVDGYGGVSGRRGEEEGRYRSSGSRRALRVARNWRRLGRSWRGLLAHVWSPLL